jgi:hypothetical protein
MQYMLTWTITPENITATNDRFSETGGLPPEGVTMLGRWIRTDNGGFALCESEDIVAIGKWLHDWNDLLDFEIHPVASDEQYAAVIAP